MAAHPDGGNVLPQDWRPHRKRQHVLRSPAQHKPSCLQQRRRVLVLAPALCLQSSGTTIYGPRNVGALGD
jgi:hypothetical protein